MEFDLIGIDASMANAFRRILISEVIDGIILESTVVIKYFRYPRWPLKKSIF